jgi:type I restriction enzyme S subunit
MNNVVDKILVAVPPLEEQIAYSQKMSDIESLIVSTEKLIEKKRNIKQGVMQELLTGKRRLAGFSGEWEKLPLSDVTWFQEGPGVRTSQFTQSGVKLFNGSNINNNEIDLENTNRFISDTEAYGMYAHFLADDGDVVIASSGITIDKFEEKVSLIRREHLPLCMNTSTIRFKVKDRLLERDFLYFFLQSTDFKVQIGGQATGSAQLNFGPSHLEKVFIRYPSDMTEQRELTKIIKDIEMELSISVEKLSKLKQIKKGAMQQLLTGKIRLINK